MFIKTFRYAAMAALPAAALLGGAPAEAQLQVLNQLCIDKYGSNQQPRVPFETREVSADGMTTTLTTPPAVFPEGDSFGPNPPNLVPTKYEDAETCRGTPIPNTLPSTPENPYNLHDDPVVTPIDKTSPTDDLDAIMDRLEAMLAPSKRCRTFGHREFCYWYYKPVPVGEARSLASAAVDIIEGNDLPGELSEREYEGFPLLHYLGGLKTKSVDPATKSVDVTQLWYDSHIESDTNYIDPTVVNDEEWTINYKIKVLNRGHEDFAPYMMVFDDPNELDFSNETVNFPDGTSGPGPNLQGRTIPNVGLDQTFFPMEEGQLYELSMKMPPARMWNLSYHWGWRVHPPRVQVTENVNVPLANGQPRNAAEIGVFGANPRESEEAKLAAISMIGDTAPAKRMWRMFREIAGLPTDLRSRFGARAELRTRLPLIREAFSDWLNRNKLPTGYEMAEDADLTVLFLNNTMYGQVRGHNGKAEVRIDGFWDKRGDQVKIQLLNGDYYVHAYVLVDFGGLRGWENTFHNTLPLGGAGPLFTFGRNYFWIHVAGQGPIPVPPATRPEEPVVTPAAHPGYANGQAFMRGRMGNPSGQGDHPFSSWGGLMQPVDTYTTAQGIGEHRLNVNFTYEPSRRLRMYQFDALHHDVAVWSVH